MASIVGLAVSSSVFNLLVSILSSSSCNSSIESVDEIFNATVDDSDEDSILSFELFLSLINRFNQSNNTLAHMLSNISRTQPSSYGICDSFNFVKKQLQTTNKQQE